MVLLAHNQVYIESTVETLHKNRNGSTQTSFSVSKSSEVNHNINQAKHKLHDATIQTLNINPSKVYALRHKDSICKYI